MHLSVTKTKPKNLEVERKLINSSLPAFDW